MKYNKSLLFIGQKKGLGLTCVNRNFSKSPEGSYSFPWASLGIQYIERKAWEKIYLRHADQGTVLNPSNRIYPPCISCIKEVGQRKLILENNLFLLLIPHIHQITQFNINLYWSGEILVGLLMKTFALQALMIKMIHRKLRFISE